MIKNDDASDEFEVFVEVWEITERREGAVYKTKFLKHDWVPMSRRGGNGANLIYCPPKPEHSQLPRRRERG